MNFFQHSIENRSITCTVPCKCKLTVTRNSNFATRSSILETRKLRVSRLESSASSIELSALSFEAGKQRTSRVISFSHVLSEATVQFLFTGTNPRDGQLCLRFCWSDVRTCICSSWKELALQAFSHSLPITTESIVRF